MPSLPPGLEQWLPSGLVTAVLAILWYEIRAGEARQTKRIDELREDMKEGFSQFREELKVGEARHQADMKELRSDMNEGFAQFRAAMQASEARQREDMKEFRSDMQAGMVQLKADNRALGEKLDRLVEGMFAARQS